jgi:hypothetical protein
MNFPQGNHKLRLKNVHEREMHVSFKIHYRNNLIDKKHSYLIPRPPSWDDRNCSYGHQLYPSDCNQCLKKNSRQYLD